MALMAVVGAVLYGTTAALPLFMQTLLGFPALQSGLALSPRGVGAFVMNIFVGRFIGRVSNRLLMAIGFSLLGISSFMLGRVNLEVGVAYLIWPSVINGIALSFIFVPLTTATMGHLRQDQLGNAAGIFNLMRNLGGSFGIAIVTTIVSRRQQVHQALMVRTSRPTTKPTSNFWHMRRPPWPPKAGLGWPDAGAEPGLFSIDNKPRSGRLWITFEFSACFASCAAGGFPLQTRQPETRPDGRSLTSRNGPQPRGSGESAVLLNSPTAMLFTPPSCGCRPDRYRD